MCDIEFHDYWRRGHANRANYIAKMGEASLFYAALECIMAIESVLFSQLRFMRNLQIPRSMEGIWGSSNIRREILRAEPLYHKKWIS